MDSDNQINVRYMTDFYEMHCIWYFIASAHCISWLHPILVNNNAVSLF